MYDTYDLVVDQLEIAETESIREEIIAALPDQTWCHRGFWSLSLYEALKSGWDEFVEQVKYRTRYLFTVAEEPTQSPSATREQMTQEKFFQVN
jgi:HEPN/RES N-terminal domain 1